MPDAHDRRIRRSQRKGVLQDLLCLRLRDPGHRAADLGKVKELMLDDVIVPSGVERSVVGKSLL